MSAYVYYPTTSDCGTLPPYNCSPCIRPELGRVRSIAIIDTTFVFNDASNPAEWDAGILSGDITVIWETQGTYDGGATQELPGWGDRAFTNGGITHTLNFKDPNLTKNWGYYQSLRNLSNKKLAFRTQTQTWMVNVPVTFTPKSPVADDLKSIVQWDVQAKWEDPTLPEPFITPAGIFTECYEVAP